MSLIRIIIGGLIGGAISVGSTIGLIYGGIQVTWWLAIILSVVATVIGGFIAGFIARDKFPGMIAGAFSGLLVFGAIVLFCWLVLRNKIIDWYTSFADINQTITALLDFLGIESTSTLGQKMTDTLTDLYSTYSSDIDLVVQNYVPKFSLIVGAIFGGGAFLVNTAAGRFGGRMNKIDELTGQD
ncbi:MAG: hypothetical protein FK734_07870 [Asgard group archaeon]|nr:hypothetical protein [Asgard group archaeon]